MEAAGSLLLSASLAGWASLWSFKFGVGNKKGTLLLPKKANGARRTPQKQGSPSKKSKEPVGPTDIPQIGHNLGTRHVPQPNQWHSPNVPQQAGNHPMLRTCAGAGYFSRTKQRGGTRILTCPSHIQTITSVAFNLNGWALGPAAGRTCWNGSLHMLLTDVNFTFLSVGSNPLPPPHASSTRAGLWVAGGCL